MNQGFNVDRNPDAEISPLFIERWSPRSFDPDFKIDKDEVRSIFEAARWAPSSFNEQPWVFPIAYHGTGEFSNFLEILVDQNQKWAKDASILGFMVCKRSFSKNDKENSCAELDCGSAWMSLTLRARQLGHYTHGMAGIHKDKAYDILNVNRDTHKVLAAFVIGKKANPDRLPNDLAEQEKPNSRKPLDEVFREGPIG